MQFQKIFDCVFDFVLKNLGKFAEIVFKQFVVPYQNLVNHQITVHLKIADALAYTYS